MAEKKKTAIVSSIARKYAESQRMPEFNINLVAWLVALVIVLLGLWRTGQSRRTGLPSTCRLY